MSDIPKMPIITKVKGMLENSFEFRYNTVLDLIEYRKKGSTGPFIELTDNFVNSIWVQLCEKKIVFPKQSLLNLLGSSFSKPYHPFRDYFENLIPWDGHDHIDDLAHTVETLDDGRWAWYLKKWLVAMVACAVNDIVTNHTVLLLCGPQAAGKTTWLNKLVPKQLIKYRFIGTINPGDKDSLSILNECILINLDEFESLSPSVQSRLKSLITLEGTRYRRAYRMNSKAEVRRASFCASVNDPDFLVDDTGSRRYLCAEIKRIDYQHQIDMSKVYSQAYDLLKNGFKFHLTSQEAQDVTAYNQRFRTISQEEELLLEHVRKPHPPEKGFKKTANEIVSYICLVSGNESSDHASAIRFGKALTKMGFNSGKSNGNKFYYVIFKDQ